MNYTQEIFNELTPYRVYLYTAYYGNYVRFNSIQEKKTLAEIYTKYFGKKSKIDNGCGGCTLNEMKQLGRLYFEDEKIIQKGLESKEDNTTDIQVVTNNKTIKRSQKKKE